MKREDEKGKVSKEGDEKSNENAPGAGAAFAYRDCKGGGDTRILCQLCGKDKEHACKSCYKNDNAQDQWFGPSKR